MSSNAYENNSISSGGATNNKILCGISYMECLKIICYSIVLGYFALIKTLMSKVFRLSRFEWRDRDNPPPCLIDTTLGQHSYVKLKGKGIKLHYVEAGERGRPVLIFLHGFPDCWISWHHQLPALSCHFRVIALDLKGFGDSDKPQFRHHYKIDALLDEIISFISSLGIMKCSIIGHDLGALIGWYLVHTNPDLVSKFVAISCPHPNIYWSSIPNTSRFNTNWIHFSQLPFLPELDALKNDLAVIDECYRHLDCEKNVNNKNYIDAYKYTFSRKEDWTGAINYLRTLPFCRLDDDNLLQTDVPCLLIVGKKDPSVLLETVVKSTEYAQKYYLKVIEDAGHYPHQQCPEQVNKALISFLLDWHLTRKLKSAPPSLMQKTADTITGTMKYGTDVLTNIKNDPNRAMYSLISKAFHFGKINNK